MHLLPRSPIAGTVLLMLLLFVAFHPMAQPARVMLKVTEAGKGKVNPMIDNMGYWRKMVKLGYVLAEPERDHPPVSHFSGILPANSPDIPVTGETDVTQSENSVFIDPNDEFVVLNSNNSSSWESGFAEFKFGADALWSQDVGQTWGGSTAGVNGDNAGDPTTAIGLNGWWYVGKITASFGQSVSYSKDQGKTWTRVNVGAGPTAGLGVLDKNHLWIDNSFSSPYEGFLYDAWTNFIPGSPDTNQIQLVRSTDAGISWSPPAKISAAAGAQKLNHGVNICTGPDGDVYVAWSIYDTWPSDETAIGFTRSSDGGASFSPATRIISNIKGIRASLTSKNMRVHSFPCMAADISNGPRRGTLYLVWPNIGTPGINTGTDIDIYLIRSTDKGNTWSAPIRVNQDPPGLGKQHYFPWITCDPVTGGLCVIYYDDRNLSPSQAAVFVSYSYDGGLTWSDFQVSDHTFTPEPIPGLAFSYFGDYLGIQSQNMKVYPVWTDNHEGGRAMSYASPFDLGPNPGQPWVVYRSDSLAPVGGTGPSGLNYGDSLSMTLELKNIGDQPARHVTAYLSSPSPWILITDSTAYYDSIGAGASLKIPNGFTFRVSDTIPDGLPVRFNVRVNSPDSSLFNWNSHFSLEARAPGLQVSGPVVTDTLSGNQNHRLEPGEEAWLEFTLANRGDFVAPEVKARLESLSPFILPAADSLFPGDILPGQSVKTAFRIRVADDTPPGTAIPMRLLTESGLYRQWRNVRLVAGQVAEDWETGTFLRYPWQSGGTKPWMISSLNPYEGIWCARSGYIIDYQSSQLRIEYTSAADDSISFYVKTSTEQDYDNLYFAIDGVRQGQWSGETPWSRVAFPVAAGTHTFHWNYQKDLSFAAGSDIVWLDYIAFPRPVVPSVDPGSDDTVCAGDTVFLQSVASMADSVRWSTSGDGIFANDTARITNYFPGPSDLQTGHVLLRLTGYGLYASAVAQKRVTIHPLPGIAIHATPGLEVCAGQVVALACDTAGIAAFLWQPGGQTTSVALFDTAITGGTGAHLVVLTVTGRNGCANTDTVTLLFKDCTGITEMDQTGWSVTPNPGAGIFTLRLENPALIPTGVTVATLAGGRILSIPIPAEKTEEMCIDLRNQPDGIYLLFIHSPNRIHLFKLVKKTTP